jgi:hypothetical protein
MAQTDSFALGNVPGATFRGNLNAILAALQSANSGATAPTATAAGMLWFDTTSPGVWKYRNAADDAWLLLFADGAVTNAKLANVATATMKGRIGAGTGVPEDLTVAEVQTLLGITSGGGNAFEIFTASGTWTKPAGLSDDTPVTVEMWGGGGGGSATAAAGGGGGGGFASRTFRAGDLGATETVTVGAGGAINLPGGNSTFGSLLTAYGGGGGGGTFGGRGGGETEAGGGFQNGGEIGGGFGAQDAVGEHARSIFGGGGGGDGFAGGRAAFGGGGGGSVFGANPQPGGVSAYGGNGGAGNLVGVAPAGGGGRNATGARGECRVYI